MRAAYRIETERLVARCWSPTDAPRLRASLDDNDHHLRPYIPWMRDEPQALDATVQRLRLARAAFDADGDYKYALLEPGEQRLAGEVVLLRRAGPGALEIGYWIDRHLTGRGLATEATAAVVRVAFEIIGVERVEIHHSAENAASAAVPQRLGFQRDATLRRRARDSDDVTRDLTVWSLFADEYAASAASRIAIFAYDCLGEPITMHRGT